MEDIEPQLAARDRARKRLYLSLTPEQRLERMGELQRRAFALLRANPAGWDHFIRRNYKARAVGQRGTRAS